MKCPAFIRSVHYPQPLAVPSTFQNCLHMEHTRTLILLSGTHILLHCLPFSDHLSSPFFTIPSLQKTFLININVSSHVAGQGLLTAK